MHGKEMHVKPQEGVQKDQTWGFEHLVTQCMNSMVLWSRFCDKLLMLSGRATMQRCKSASEPIRRCTGLKAASAQAVS